MAVWRAENSMLTQRGMEILNKVKAGIGKLTITRIVAGSGRVAESNLFFQTDVSGTTKLMSLSEATTRDLGSEISIYITNSGFTESFNLNQIGVYVTHPDYMGEHLYHISQCDESEFDVLPAEEDTPVTVGYSIFLEHGSSSSISITVDPQGMLSTERFTKFIENIVPGKLLSASPDGNLQDSGKSVSELYNPNLLTNTYFKSPVNRKNGYVVPPNTPYYSDTGLTTKVGNTSTYVQVTRVNSSYGYITVSSKIYYVLLSSAVEGYTGLSIAIDRCKIATGVNAYVLLDTNGVRFGNTGSEVGYIRHSASVTPSQAVGHKFTLSILTADGRLFTTTTTSEYDGSANCGIANIDIDGVKAYIYSSGSDFFGAQLQVQTSKEVNLQAMKLEFGTQQTLAHQDAEGNWVLNEIPNFAVEVAKCIQYSLVDDRYMGGVPGGQVEEEVYVQSAEELDSRLELIYNNMENGRMKYVLVAFAVSHPILGGSNRLVQIFRSNQQYGSIRAFSYTNNTNGVTLEHTRSRFNGVWTDWARTYNDHFKPTLAELGAAPSGYGLGDRAFIKATSVSVIDTLVKSGWYSVEFGVATTIIPNYIGTYLQVRVDAYGATNLVQTAKFTNSNFIIQRIMIGGAWQPWCWVNPPLTTNVEFRTTEYYQGRLVFKKVDSNGNLLWRREDETDWRTSSSTYIAPATIELEEE